MHQYEVAVVFGTRPEAIKLAPLIRLLKQDPQFNVTVVNTGQHKELVDDVCSFFEIPVDVDLKVMSTGQTLEAVTGSVLSKFSAFLEQRTLDLVIAQGDTTSVFAVALSCFYRALPVAHVEAGLRTPDIFSPFPEEFNRRSVSLLASQHFAPTQTASNNLLREGVSSECILVTGNTSIDAVKLAKQIVSNQKPPSFVKKNTKMILVTCHRRENFGKGVSEIIKSVNMLSERYPEFQFIWIKHPNPAISTMIDERLKEGDNLLKLPAVVYPDFVWLLSHAWLILSDSGGVQEEATAVGTPVLVTRESTERPEAIEIGANLLVGADASAIFSQVSVLKENPEILDAMSKAGCPYGDGNASKKIHQFLVQQLGEIRSLG